MAKQTNANIDNLTFGELTALIEAAKAKKLEKIEEAKAALVREMTEKAAELGLKLTDLKQPENKASRQARKDAGSSVQAKYRRADGQEWSGRGRLPTWLKEEEANGRKREEFLV